MGESFSVHSSEGGVVAIEKAGVTGTEGVWAEECEYRVHGHRGHKAQRDTNKGEQVSWRDFMKEQVEGGESILERGERS